MLETPPMERRRDSTQNFHPSDELEDDGGLELSLGLCCGGSRNKGKGSEGSNFTIPPEVTVEPGGCGEGTSEKPKYGRGSCLDAALKKFLEGRLDEQEESGRLLDGYHHQQGTWDFNGSCNKDLEKSICNNSLSSRRALGSHDGQLYPEKFGQRDLLSNLDSKRNSALFKEIQLPSGMASAWGQLGAQGMPLHFIDAMKSGSSAGGLAAMSTALLSHFAEVEGDKGELQRAMVQQNNGLQQQRKFHEARKKRKYLIEEQKQQKKVKKDDDRTGLHEFRRPGKNSWVPGLDATAPALDAERAFFTLSENEDGEEVPEIRGALQSERGRPVVDSETEQDESTGTPGDDSNGVEVNFIPQLRPEEVGKISRVGNRAIYGVHGDTWHLKMLQPHAGGKQSLAGMAHYVPDIALEGAPGLCCNQQAGEMSTLSPQRADSPSQREKVSCQRSSTGADYSEKKEEQSCDGDGEASSAPPTSIGSDIPSASTNAPFLSPVPLTSPHPYPLTSFSVVPMPYSLPVPGPNATSVPFPLGFSFPYLMQSVPPSPDGQEQNSTRPFNNSTFLLSSGNGYQSLQIPPSEGAPPWVQVQRPPTAAPFSNSNSAAAHGRTLTGVADDNNRPQGLNVHGSGSGSGQVLTSATDTSTSGSHPLFRAASLNCNQDPVMAFSQSHQVPDPQLLSSLSVPAVPQFGPLRTVSDPVELRSFKEHDGINAFPGFAASVQVAQGLPGAQILPSNGIEEGGGRRELRVGKGDTATEWQVHRIEDSIATESNNFGQEEFGRALGGQFHKGSTNILPVSDGLAQELANLRPGIPPGLKVGGTGSSPDLPWVSTTGPGPNSRAICGVLYRFSRGQVKIVCACHGKHMSPSEFVQHAGGVDVSNPEKNIVVNPFPLTGQLTSA